MFCKNCAYYASEKTPDRASDMLPPVPSENLVGDCRLKSPNFEGLFPQVDPESWCGEMVIVRR
jgi:hypothetical protein